jgi:hypothetical protein
MMQDRKGSDPGYPVPGTWDLGPDTRYLISTEDRVPANRYPRLGHPASCIL